MLNRKQRKLIQEQQLTGREVEALELLSEFLENKEIADRLNLSLPTVKKVLRSAFRKLGVQCGAEAAALWIRR
jgi:two-component system response regulator TtrR